jgi:long-subunit acyl-CoA synthetase (AMP-forming)
LTAQVKDAEGWFHTGDVGEIDDHLRIKVIDRVKVGYLSCMLIDVRS